MPTYIVFKNGGIPALPFLKDISLRKTFTESMPSSEDFSPGEKVEINGVASNVISLHQALKMSERFGHQPRSLEISEKNLEDFLTEVKALKVVPPNKLGLRFYIGQEAQNKRYGTVMVPTSVPPLNGDLDHEHALEKQLFKDSGIEFLGLAPQENGPGKIIHVTSEAADIVKQTDLMDHRMLFHLHEDFTKFKKLMTGYDTVYMMFGRTTTHIKSDAATLIVLFFKEGNPAPMSTKVPAGQLVGFCYDQGDLMPPPDVPDASL